MTAGQLPWPPGDGEMARRIRAHRWAATPLGPVEGWPERLRAAVELMLDSRQPVSVNWGPDDGGVTLYNEGYIPILGAKHPRALGGSYREVWPEIWDEYRPVIAATMAGEAHSFVDRPVPLAGRDGRPMSWFTFSLTPLRDGAGAAAGFFCAATETTDAVLARERLREGEARLRVATEANGVGTWELVVRGDGTTTALTSPRHDAIFGHDEPVPAWDAEIFLSHVLPGHRDGVARRLREAVEAGRAWRFGAPIRPAGGGGPRWIAAHGQPVERDAGGRAVRFVGVVQDVTDIHDTTAALREGEARQAFLLRLTDALRPLADAGAIAAEASRLLGEHLRADRTFMTEVDADGMTLHVRDEHLRAGASSVLGRYRFDQFGAFVGRALHQGRTLAVEDVSARADLDAAERANYAAVGIAAYLLVPLVRGGRLAAYLTVNHRTPRAWTEADGAVARQAADRVWADMERARAEAALREGEARNALLVRFSDEVRGLSDPALVAEASCRILTERLGTDRALWAVVDWDRRDYVAEWAFLADGTRAGPSRWPLDPREPFAAEHLAGRSVVYDDGEADPRIPGPAAAAMAERGLRAGIAVPVLVAGTLRAVLNTSQPTAPRRWRPADVAFVEALAGRAWAEIERARAEAALRESEARLAAVFEVLPVGVSVFDAHGALLLSNQEVRRFMPTGVMPSRDEARRSRWRAWHPDGRPVGPQDFPGARALRGERVVPGIEMLHTDDDGREVWTSASAVPLRDRDGRITGTAVVVAGIDTLKRLQGQQGVLIAELQHRTRNLLGVVRSLARSSIRPSPGLDEYDARVAALGRVQGFLSRSSLYSVALTDLVEAELVAAGEGASERVTVGGPPVTLPGEGVQTVALALHELATNAVKHGAIAQALGRLSVTWRVEDGDADGSGRLVIDWHESGVAMPGGGPPVRRGHGTELITRALPYQLDAETELVFGPDGVRCRIVLPSGAFSRSSEEVRA